ncbi:hypothetical protein CFC21_110068 [Triticum aestivum]|uniref:J domain-containing protein n=2 Tax=Triticum aestivum TaxID=4565 RepID=A0A3B6N1Y7_WHEAT|nr:hypothetical protein CFC21_110068 [Triticum aestivum]
MADAAGKAQAARDVCAASAAFASCPHRRRSPRRAHFVDWYLVLAVRIQYIRMHILRPPRCASVFGVVLINSELLHVWQIGEAASEDAIKRRYRHLALQLHPDKNRHPKAEVAFKLVSEAHACLTDKARRRAFDAERATAFCAACHDRARAATTPCAPTRRRASDRRTPASSEAASAQQQHNKARGSVAKQQGGGRRRPPSPTTQALREVQNRLRDECRVIDGCLRANAAGARRRQSFPLFDPSDRQRFPDYPHARPPPSFAECRPFEEEEELGAGHGHQSWCTNGSCESPVYQVRTAPERAARTNRPW